MKNNNAGRLEGKEKLLNKRCHAELVSASSTQAVLKQQQQASKILNQVQDDFINNTTASGFTLIELLVVVLIIGILAAVALPQYQKAVEKSRATTIFPLLRSIGDAQENYYMDNGTYAMSFNELVLDIPFTGTIKGMTFYPLRDVRSNEDWSIQLYPDLNAVFASRLTGPYAGAAFAYQYGDWNCVPGNRFALCAHMLTCVVKTETAGGVFLDRKQYDKYCEKIFKATRTVESISIGHFHLMP